MALDEPCDPWPIDGMCCPNWLPADTQVPDPDTEGVAARLAAQAYAVEWASAFLWKRSRRRLGVCTRTVRFCPPCCFCTPCTCGPQHIITLSPDVPVMAITSIRNVCADVVIDPARYAIINDSGVGLVDQTCGWLSGSPFDCELEIVFTSGWEPDIEALAAGSALACAFVDACTATNCKAGDFLKMTAGFYKRGKRDLVLTGVPLTDQWLIDARSGGSSGMMDPSDPMPYVVS